VVEARLNNLAKRIAALESRPTHSQVATQPNAPLHPGSSVESSSLQNAQPNQIEALQNEITALKAELTKFQTQFDHHYHTYTVSSDPGAAHSIQTILNCKGQGQPCTSASGLTSITVWTPPLVTPPPLSQSTVKTSGPVQPGK
jgi:hypothetical protein